ncbi:unnamed protein product [Rotaria sordida]|uniref:Uncharacterized protein n=1 Tax=Rotaria sordida TaxID=392033 RepID=A0A815HL24_9BILA|nr:unnamed protein product [Rotaria sordida]CAF1603400.1 unnamed protein product [Rotaria sordida]
MIACLLSDIECSTTSRLYISSRITVTILLIPLEIVLNDALNIVAINNPVKPGNRPNVSITNKGYNYKQYCH